MIAMSVKQIVKVGLAVVASNAIAQVLSWSTNAWTRESCINRDDLDNIVQDVFGCISPTECHGFGTVFQVAEIAL